MSIEPGERRRRREAERARQRAAAEDSAGAASAPDTSSLGVPDDDASSGPSAGGTPISGASDGASTDSAPDAGTAPPVTASIPVIGPDGTRLLSRRELRELERRRAAEAGEELPVDLPAGTGRTGHGPHGRRSADPLPGGPDRQEPPSGATALLPAQRSGPPRSTTRSSTPAPTPTGAGSTTPMTTSPTPPVEAGGSASGPAPRPAAERASLPSVPVLPGRSSQTRTDGRPGAASSPPGTVGDLGAAPSGEPTRKPGSPADRTAASTTPGPPTPRDPSSAAPGGAAASGASSDEVATPGPRQEDLDEHDAGDAPPEHHRYTKVHLLVLLLVAFVLGFLVWSLTTRGTDDGADAAHALPTQSSSDVPATDRGAL